MADYDQYKMQNSMTQYSKDGFPKQQQNPPGLQTEMTPAPDCGEKSYRGTGRLEGRKALVTGADSGIGRAAAIAFAREGTDLALAYHPSEHQDAEQVAELVKEAGRKVVLLPGDLRDESVNVKVIEDALNQFGGLDILALVADKQTAVKDIADLTTEQFRETFESNVFSLFWMTKAALPHLRPGASIITTSSTQAYQPSPTLLDYASTKAAILNYTRSLAKQVAQKGIRVNCVAPGPIHTVLAVSGGQPTDALPSFGTSTLLGRAGQPAELAPIYVYLASQESSHVTAEVHGVTGAIIWDKRLTG